MPTTTQTSGVPDWMRPYYESYFNSASQVANRPYQQYQGQRIAGMTPIQEQGLLGIQGAMGGNAGTQAGQRYAADVASGVDSSMMRDRMERGVTDSYNQATAAATARFNSPGNFGGSRHQMMQERANQALATGLTDGFGAIEMQDRNSRLNAGNQAMNMNTQQMNNYLMGMNAGNLPRGIQQGLLDVDYGDWQNQWNYPNQQLETLRGGLGAMGSGAGTVSTSSTPDPSRSSQNAGMILSALPWLFGGKRGSAQPQGMLG